MKLKQPDGKFKLEIIWKGDSFLIKGKYYARYPGTPPSYASGGNPPQDAFLEDVSIWHFGEVECSDEFTEFLLESGLRSAIIEELENTD